MYLNTDIGYKNLNKLLKDKSLYVDKSEILSLLNKRIDTDRCYICITRPRRFGKSQITYMLESYYSKAVDSEDIFNTLNISKFEGYKQHLNQYNVIRIDFSSIDTLELDFKGYLGVIKRQLSMELEKLYTTQHLEQYIDLPAKLLATKDKFIFIIDEWDFIFNKGLYISNQEDFLEFLRLLLKDRPYVALCYMTGILPIKKYSTGSALNMFSEYSFLNDSVFDKYFGFTQTEVKLLCESRQGISYNEIAEWYNGYVTEDNLRLFNPRSVKEALENNKCKSYWSNVGSMNEVTKLLRLNSKGVRDDVIRMLNKEAIPITIRREFRAGSDIPTTREDIYSAMITWGFLSYYNEEIRIPNYELMIEFELALRDMSFGTVAELIGNSDDMLRATLALDTDKVAQIVHEIINISGINHHFSYE
ncbi:MAG: hypothetical protein ATN33_07600 [Epulopiscium sp. Nele67-Bin001]|nr:MAG: hypothetical protein ATN33_07600 [Epulopiscium sp. Nele67-Bin001]